jgi:DNA-binding NarL/FixJ family response regulator
VNDADMKMLLQEMEWVRKLLVLQLLISGCKQTEIAAALGISNATMTRMMPKGLAKKIKAGRASVGVMEE